MTIQLTTSSRPFPIIGPSEISNSLDITPSIMPFATNTLELSYWGNLIVGGTTGSRILLESSIINLHISGTSLISSPMWGAGIGAKKMRKLFKSFRKLGRGQSTVSPKDFIKVPTILLRKSAFSPQLHEEWKIICGPQVDSQRISSSLPLRLQLRCLICTYVLIKYKKFIINDSRIFLDSSKK